jgi:hypothetical protein
MDGRSPRFHGNFPWFSRCQLAHCQVHSYTIGQNKSAGQAHSWRNGNICPTYSSRVGANHITKSIDIIILLEGRSKDLGKIIQSPYFLNQNSIMSSPRELPCACLPVLCTPLPAHLPAGSVVNRPLTWRPLPNCQPTIGSHRYHLLWFIPPDCFSWILGKLIGIVRYLVPSVYWPWEGLEPRS